MQQNEKSNLGQKKKLSKTKKCHPQNKHKDLHQGKKLFIKISKFFLT